MTKDATSDNMTNAGAASQDVLTVDEAAALLRVNPKTLRCAIAAGEVPGVVRLRRVIRLSRPALLEWLSGKQAT